MIYSKVFKIPGHIIRILTLTLSYPDRNMLNNTSRYTRSSFFMLLLTIPPIKDSMSSQEIGATSFQ